ncbi:MAG TPA: DoxX family protein [Sphingobacteriaceae bacterium]
MSKRNVVLYWLATIWLSLGMVSTGIVQLFQMEQELRKMETLGYQPYFLTLIGGWKLLGVTAILVPGYPLVKEWAYAGFFFLMSGAIFSHLMAGDLPQEFFGPSLLLILTCASWYLRPESRKITLTA